MQELTYIKNKAFAIWMGFNVTIMNPKCIEILGELCFNFDPSKIEKAVVDLLYNAPELSERQVNFITRYERCFSRDFVFRGKIIEKDTYVQVDMNNL